MDKLRTFTLMVICSLHHPMVAQQLPDITPYERQYSLFNSAYIPPSFIDYQTDLQIGISRRAPFSKGPISHGPVLNTIIATKIFSLRNLDTYIIGTGVEMIQHNILPINARRMAARFFIAKTLDATSAGRLSGKEFISLGFTAGRYTQSIQTDLLNPYHLGDPILELEDNFKGTFDLGWGLFYQRPIQNDNNQNPQPMMLRLGLSVPSVFPVAPITYATPIRNFHVRRPWHTHFRAGLSFHPNSDFELEPFVHLKYLRGIPLDIDLNLRCNYYTDKDYEFNIGLGGDVSTGTWYVQAGFGFDPGIDPGSRLIINFIFGDRAAPLADFYGNTYECSVYWSFATGLGIPDN